MRKAVSFKSLVLGSLCLSLLVLLVGLFVMGHAQKRAFLEDHLAQSSQDAATALALSLSTAADRGDWVAAASMIDVIFDAGAYERVVLRDMQGHGVFSREAARQFDGVPAWFVERIELRAPEASADVLGGWKKLGELTVRSNAAAAYRELWRSTRLQLGWFAVVGVAAGLVLTTFLHQMSAPLRRLSEAAERVRQKDFTRLVPVSPIRELAEVALAFNQMTEQLQVLFQQQHDTIERLRVQALIDPVTRLDNRDSFDRRLQALLQSEDGDAAGQVLLLQIEGFAQHNQRLGRQAGDVLLGGVAELIRDEIGGVRGQALAGRREGAQFVVYLGLYDEDQARRFAARLLERLRVLGRSKTAVGEGVLEFHVGIASTVGVRGVSEVLAAADFALRKAQTPGADGIAVHGPDQGGDGASPMLRLPASVWQQHLRTALEEQTFELHFQPMLKADRTEVLFHQVLLRLRLTERVLVASEFLPMAERFGFMLDIDRMVLARALQRLTDHPGEGVLCVTLSAASLHHEHLGSELGELFARFPLVVHQVLLEIPEFALRQAWAGIDQLLMLRMQRGFRIVVSRFGMSGIPFGYLETWPVNLIKLDPGLVDHVDENAQHQFYLRNIVQIAHSRDVEVIVVGVERREEMDALQALGVDGMMGYFIGRPGPEPLHLS